MFVDIWFRQRSDADDGSTAQSSRGCEPDFVPDHDVKVRTSLLKETLGFLLL